MFYLTQLTSSRFMNDMCVCVCVCVLCVCVCVCVCVCLVLSHDDVVVFWEVRSLLPHLTALHQWWCPIIECN